MKFRISRETILQPLQNVIGVVERRQTLPVLSNVLIVADNNRITMTATDLEVELVADIDTEITEAGEITIPARKLLDICRTLPDSAELDFSVTEDKAQLKSGRSRFSLSTLPATEFPSVDEINPVLDFSLPQSQLRNLIEKTHFSMAQQDVRYYLNGLLLEMQEGVLRSVATDGHRLAMSEQAASISSGDSQQVIVPRKGIQELVRLLNDDEDSQAGVQVSNNHIRVQLPGLRFTSKLIDGRFPDYQRVVPQNPELEIISERESLRQALVRTSILSNEKYRGIRLLLTNNLLKIQAHNPEQEEAEEEIEVQYSNSDMEIGFNVNYILDALNVISAEKVSISLTDANSSCLIQDTEDSSSKYVIMPMRL
jgi:DNA polymerase-3 subunit beta